MPSKTVTLLQTLKQLIVTVATMANTRLVYNTWFRYTVPEVTSVVNVEYVPEQVNVRLNGALLEPTIDYTATNGTSIEFVTPLKASDRVTLERISIDSAGTGTWTTALALKQNKEVSSSTAVTTTATVSMDGPAHQLLTLGSASCAISVTTTAVPAGEARIVNLLLKQSTGSNVFDFGTSVAWVNDAPPVPSYEAGRIDSVRLKFVPGLTKPIGFYEGGWINA